MIYYVQRRISPHRKRSFLILWFPSDTKMSVFRQQNFSEMMTVLDWLEDSGLFFAVRRLSSPRRTCATHARTHQTPLWRVEKRALGRFLEPPPLPLQKTEPVSGNSAIAPLIESAPTENVCRICRSTREPSHSSFLETLARRFQPARFVSGSCVQSQSINQSISFCQ